MRLVGSCVGLVIAMVSMGLFLGLLEGPKESLGLLILEGRYSGFACSFWGVGMGFLGDLVEEFKGGLEVVIGSL